MENIIESTTQNPTHDIQAIADTVNLEIYSALIDLIDDVVDDVESEVENAVNGIVSDVTDSVRSSLDDAFKSHKFDLTNIVRGRITDSLIDAYAAQSTQSVDNSKIDEMKNTIVILTNTVLMLEDVILGATTPTLGFFEIAEKMASARSLVLIRQQERAEEKASQA